MRRRALAIALGGTLLLVLAPLAGAELWTIRPVWTPGWAGLYSRLALDADDLPRIAYFDDTYNWDLDYLVRTESGWVQEIVDDRGEMGYHPDIAVGTDGESYIAYFGLYYAEDTFGVRFARTSPTGWVREEVETVTYGQGNPGRFPSIALDPDDHAHVSFFRADAAVLKYATNASGSWTIQQVAEMSSGQTSIAVDSDGAAHIGFGPARSPAYNLRYATNATGAWVIEVADASFRVGMYASIALDSLDRPHIGYDDYRNKGLKYATRQDGAWIVQVIPTTGEDPRHTKLALDSSDRAHIVYYDFAGGNLRYATNKSADWTVETIDWVGTNWLFTTPWGEGWGHAATDHRIGLAVDSLDFVHVSYHNNQLVDLYYATNRDAETYIDLIRFEAAADEAGVHLSWATAAEPDNAGFHLWRATAPKGRYERITDALVPAEGDAAGGAEYEFLDPHVRPGGTYWYQLEDVSLRGHSTFHGPVRATVPEGEDPSIGCGGD